MYDQRKLNAYWKEREEIWATWYKNGWKGPKGEMGRFLTFTCGCSIWAAWGVPPDYAERLCYDCEFERKINK